MRAKFKALTINKEYFTLDGKQKIECSIYEKEVDLESLTIEELEWLIKDRENKELVIESIYIKLDNHKYSNKI